MLLCLADQGTVDAADVWLLTQLTQVETATPRFSFAGHARLTTRERAQAVRVMEGNVRMTCDVWPRMQESEY